MAQLNSSSKKRQTLHLYYVCMRLCVCERMVNICVCVSTMCADAFVVCSASYKAHVVVIALCQ